MITLKTTDGHSERCEGIPEGIEVIEHTAEYEGKEFTYKTYRYPELGAPRLYGHSQGPVVVPINGQNYLITFDIETEDWGGIPHGVTVTFVPTDEPETPYEEWDAAAHQQKVRANLMKEIAEMEAEDREDGDGFWESHIESLRRNIEAIDNGEEIYGHGKYLQIFGQPVFIQNPIFPSHEGRGAYHLATIETGWGDSGNVNIMVALDDDGVPVQAYFEASCC